MAKTISDEQMKLTMIINGNSAQKELFDLEKSTRKYNEENKALLLQKKLLEKQGKKDTDQWKLLTATIKANSAEVLTNKTRMAELQKEIGLTGLTLGQLRSKATMLRNTLANLIPDSPDYLRFDAELTQVNNRLGELRGRAQTARYSIGSLADSFNRYQGMALSVVAVLTGVVFSIQKIIDINGKLSDAQADVMKTTGMNRREVDELAKSFGLLETRTSRIDLLKIAEQGGRIGIAKAEIGDFVNVMNKASVSLGDSFSGGAEEVANKLGKIKFLFQETKDIGVEQAYNSIGSAINDLGANGTASEANIADFTTRIGSLTDVLKPTIQETLALGTAFEESGIESEVSARAYGIFMKQASTETAKFAQVMGTTQANVEAMINKNPLEFMLKFSQGMKGMSATDTAKTLDALGISADGANKVIGAMGNNTARFRELIDLSNNSFADGTSLIKEYTIKNETAGATLEKISKRITGWFSSETFAKYLAGAVIWIAKFIGAAQDADGVVSKWRNGIAGFVKILAIATIALISQRTALMVTTLITNGYSEAIALSTIAQKAWNFTTTAARFVTGLFSGSLALLRIGWIWVSQGTAAATAELQIFNVATKMNPIGAFVTLLMACVAAYVLFSESADTSNDMMKTQVDIANSVSEQTSKQKQSISDLVAIMNDENATINQKKKALEQIKKISDGYLEGLTLENIATAEGTRLINRYIQSIDELANAKAMVEIKTKLRTQIIEADNKILALSVEKKNNKNTGYAGAGDDGKLFGVGGRNKQEIQSEMDDEKSKRDLVINQSNSLFSSSKKAVSNLRKNLKEQNDRLKFLKKDTKEYKELLQDINSDNNKLNTLIGLQAAPEETPITKYNPLSGEDKKVGSGKKNPNSTKEEIARRNLEESNKNNQDLLDLDRQYQDDKLALMEDGAAKELILEQERSMREIADLDKKKVHTGELAKLNEAIVKAKESGDKDEENRLLLIRQGWDAKNKAFDDKINVIKEGKLALHYKKLAAIEEKAATERIEKEQEQYDLEKMQRETAFNNEINALNLSDAEKKKRQDVFDKNEIVIAQKHIADKIAQLKSSLAEGLFSPEVQAKMEKQLAFLENAASKIVAAKDPSKQSGAEKIGDAAKSAFGETDILGFTPTQWESAFSNLDTLAGKMAAVNAVVTGLQNLWSSYSNFQKANENAQLKNFEKSSDAKKTKLKKQLDSGVISQKQYDKQVAKIDEELDAKKADIEYKQAKREKAMALVSAIISTAKGVAAALPNLFLSGFAAVVGAIQIATIMKQPLPAKGHEEGLYPEYVKREQDGKTFKSSYQGKTRSGLVSKTSHFLVAENGPEMVIDNKAWTQMDPAVKDALVRDLRGIKGFEQGYYNQDLKRYEVPAESSSSAPAQSSSSNDSQLLQMAITVISENTAVMRDLRENGVFVTNKDLKSMKNLKEGIDAFNELRTKAKR